MYKKKKEKKGDNICKIKSHSNPHKRVAFISSMSEPWAEAAKTQRFDRSSSNLPFGFAPVGYSTLLLLQSHFFLFPFQSRHKKKKPKISQWFGIARDRRGGARQRRRRWELWVKPFTPLDFGSVRRVRQWIALVAASKGDISSKNNVSLFSIVLDLSALILTAVRMWFWLDQLDVVWILFMKDECSPWNIQLTIRADLQCACVFNFNRIE